MPGGPQPFTPEQRRQRAQDIAQRFIRHYADNILAVGVYGSLAKTTDGPFSDIEMVCILREDSIDDSFEWSEGDWKAEVNILSRDVILQQAAEIDGHWPITHSAFVDIWEIHDPEGFFPILCQAALSQPAESYHHAIEDVIVGEIYERVGKIRNALALQKTSSLAFYISDITIFGACLIGLFHRHLYRSFSTVLEESLEMEDRPAGYDALCQVVMSGDLSDARRILSLVNEFWNGVELWARFHDITIEVKLDRLLRKE
jgi:kanamycin nucleotidyltransferase